MGKKRERKKQREREKDKIRISVGKCLQKLGLNQLQVRENAKERYKLY